VAEDGRQLLDRVARQHPLRREGVPRSLVPAESWLGELELSERDAEIVPGVALSIFFPSQRMGGMILPAPPDFSFHSVRIAAERRGPARCGSRRPEGALDGLADVDASRAIFSGSASARKMRRTSSSRSVNGVFLGRASVG